MTAPSARAQDTNSRGLRRWFEKTGPAISVELNHRSSLREQVEVGAQRVSLALVLLAAAAMLGARFLGLAHSPPGFYFDELLGALQVACLSQEGRTASGATWPLFAPGGDGVYTPTFLYFGFAWTKLFGFSIAAFRAIAAFFTTWTVVGIYLLAKRLAGSRVALWSLICASLSPWSFQFARLAWDPPLAPAFVVLACFFWFGDRAVRDGLLSGVFAALAMYSYPPTRMQVPLLILFLVLTGLLAKSLTLSRFLAFSVALGAACVPLGLKMLDPTFNGRTSRLAIWSTEFLSHRPSHVSSASYFIQTLAENFSMFFRPSFLFFRGDPNLRHSPQFIGELSLVDDFALALGMVLVAAAVRRLSRAPSTPSTDALLPPAAGRYIAFSLAGWFLGILPAACTHEGLPHSLRAIGAWPFLSLLLGGILAFADKRWAFVRILSAAVCIGYVAFFLEAYFTTYPRASRDWFDADIQATLTRPQLDRATKFQFAKQHPEAVRYFAISSGTATCSSSEDILRQWSAGGDAEVR